MSNWKFNQRPLPNQLHFEWIELSRAKHSHGTEPMTSYFFSVICARKWIERGLVEITRKNDAMVHIAEVKIR